MFEPVELEALVDEKLYAIANKKASQGEIVDANYVLIACNEVSQVTIHKNQRKGQLYRVKK